MSAYPGSKMATVEDYISSEEEEDGDEDEDEQSDEDGGIEQQHQQQHPRDLKPEANTQARRQPIQVSGGSTGGDAASDSGYSSHQTVTTGPPSSGRGPSSVIIPPPPPRQIDGVPPPPRRRPNVIQARTVAAQAQTQPPPRPRRETVAAADAPRRAEMMRTAPHGRCNCAACLPRRRTVTQETMPVPMPVPIPMPWDLRYPPVHTPGGYGDRPQPAMPPPPKTTVPVGAMASGPILARPRLVAAQSSRSARPMSYHEGMGYSTNFAPLRLDTQVEPMMAHQQYVPVQAAAPPPPPPPSAPPYPVSMPFGPSRPMPQRWMTERYSARPVSMYGQPLIEYDGVPPGGTQPLARRPSNRESSSRRARTQEEEDYSRMPPPPIPSAPPPPPPPPPPPGVPQSHRRELSRSRSVPRRSDGYLAGSDRVERPSVPSQTYRGSALRRPSSHSIENERRHELQADELARFQAADRRRRRASYYGGDGNVGQVREQSRRRYQQQQRREREDDDDEDDEGDDDDDDYYDAGDAHAAAMRLEGLSLRGMSTRVGSNPGQHGRPSASREVVRGGGGEGGRARPSSGVAVNVPDADENFTMRFNSSAAGVKLDFTGGFDGRTVSLKAGQDGEQAELSIGARKTYIDRHTGAHLEYARSGRRREIDHGALTAPHSRSSTHSRRSSRAAVARREYGS